jgi:hypothetical protein
MIFSTFLFQAVLAPTPDNVRRRIPYCVRSGLDITDNDDDNNPPSGRRLSRTTLLLDSLAQVCVSGSEVFAIGVTVRGSWPYRYKLVVAKNNGVDEAVQAYILELILHLSNLFSAVASEEEDASLQAPSLTMKQIERCQNQSRASSAVDLHHLLCSLGLE